MTRIGITGGIGSGKSVVSELLRMMGVPVYDTDSKAKELQTTCATLKAQLTALMGPNYYLGNGELNKPYISERIFSDRDLLLKINSIVHPAVIADFNQWVAAAEKKGYPIVGLESAILFQSKLDQHLDQVWTVDAPIEVCIERACLRDNKSREHIEARIKNQKPTKGLGDHSITNDGKHSLIRQVSELLLKTKSQ